MPRYIFQALLALLLMATACGKTGVDVDGGENSVSLSFSVTDFETVSSSRSTRATTPASNEEKAVKNIYVFLFSSTQPVIKYNNADAANVGTWTQAEGKVTLQKTQTEAGTRDVYVVANFPADMKAKLDAVTTLDQLKIVVKTLSPPWTLGTDIATAGLLMEGHAAHDFTANHQLQTIPLNRAVAKLSLNVTLNETHQSANTADYGYKYINWGAETWAVEKADAQTAAATASHAAWQAISGIAAGPEGKVTAFSLTAYINEYANTAATDPTATVELKLPYDDGGFLPPPEFGDGDIYRLKLPAVVKRNTAYEYSIDVDWTGGAT